MSTEVQSVLGIRKCFISLPRTSHEIARVKIVFYCSFFPPNLKPVIKFLIAFSLTSEIDSVSLIFIYLHMYDYLFASFQYFPHTF